VAAATSGSGKSERPPYEQARDELTELVKRLEAGGLTLEQSLQLWERGEELAAICEDWLEGARARLATALADHEQAHKGQPDQGQADRGQARRGQAQQPPGAPF
jgi:exodeoxyribonuclease VII small subunit